MLLLSQRASRNWLMKFHACVPFGRRPVEKDIRDGEQTAICTYARSKTMPVSACERRFGYPPEH